MRLPHPISYLLVLLLLTATGLFSASFELQYDRLQPALTELSSADRDIVQDSVNLIRQGEHLLALSRLSSLKQRSPQNSSLRILASYAILQAGNVVGAFAEAEKAHEAPNGNSYKCWFLAKVALLNGKKDVCERELKHVRGSGDMVTEVKQLEQELKQN